VTTYPIHIKGFNDIGKCWRSKWLRLGTRSSLTHCTVTIGQNTLHVSANGCNWYPTNKLFHTYEGVFNEVESIYIGSIKRPIFNKPKRGSTWSVIRWKYLRGPRPTGCTTACIDALKENGIDCPELIIPHELIKYFKNDYFRTKRKSPRRKNKIM
jgi:hypothetical protein